MGMLKVSVISPEATLFEGAAPSVTAPAFDGEVGILPMHAPMVTTLGAGVLKVGVMSGAVPALLESGVGAYKKGTLAAGARLEIVVVPVKVRCPDCGGEAVREDSDYSCAGCGSRRVEIVEGRELVIEKIELET